MGEISLVVTEAVLAEVGRGHDFQKQIALRKSSNDISAHLANINRDNMMTIILGNSIRLIVGDIGAIWRAHNNDHLEDFDDIYNLLSRRPDEEFRSICHIE
ncbi:MAG: hypothetical protein JRJ85_20140 [Deltaproteobacteria bacterium]|nr:hypothetical protein [Deltaproteobacteria bacterium]